LADLHFAPTVGARDNLLREGVAPERVHVTGNTAIDALLYTLRRDDCYAGGCQGRSLLLTAHRRENHGAPMERICDAVLLLLDRYPDLTVNFPVHLSPRVRATVFDRLQYHSRVSLTDPLGYRGFVGAMHRARVILTDSGGVQEEAPSLGKPVLVLRDTTERPEAVEAGTALLIGTDRDRIVHEVSRLLDDADHYAGMACANNPYGDGKAAARVLDAIFASSARGSRPSVSAIAPAGPAMRQLVRG
ncbi:MAG TPA: UDP-N-acetylglucosamine 2-epimerase (non-hydrolyzing), partial [Polyangiales bacterium]|nr:UDP-N-acetylglucosamine 2-epimerase (non-hydrolyzing) [Polyangiales bacterium]